MAPSTRPLTMVVRILLALLSVAVLMAVGMVWFNVQLFRANTNTTNALHGVASQGNQPPVDDGATDILLVGTDSRTDLQGNPLPTSVLTQLRTQWDAGLNTDTLIVLRLPNNGSPAYAISIPRDSYVAVPGLGMTKINGAYGLTKVNSERQLEKSGKTSPAAVEQQSDEAGQVALVGAVQNLTGVHIDHYAEVGLYGFYLISNAIGGVPVCLREATVDKDSGSDFPAGYQVISGTDALSFVRQRKNLPDGDLDRIVRQQAFLKSAVKKLISAGVLTNPTALNQLLDATKKSLVTDPGLDLLALVQQAQALTSGNVTFKTIPVVNGSGRSPDGQSIVVVDPNQVRKFFAGLTTGVPATPTTSTTPTTATPSVTPSAKPAPAASTSRSTVHPAAAQFRIAEPSSINGVPCVY